MRVEPWMRVPGLLTCLIRIHRCRGRRVYLKIKYCGILIFTEHENSEKANVYTKTKRSRNTNTTPQTEKRVEIKCPLPAHRQNYGELTRLQPKPKKTLGKPVFSKETKENLRKTKKTKDIPKNTKKALG